MDIDKLETDMIDLMPQGDNIKWALLYFITEHGQIGELNTGRMLHSVPLEPHQLGIIVGILTKVLRQQISDFERQIDPDDAIKLRAALEHTLALEEIKPGDQGARSDENLTL